MHYAEAATAGDGTKAVEYASRAGDLALERLAYDEAVECYQLAKELLGTTDAPIDEQRRGRLLLVLGTAQRLAGDRHADATLKEAARVASRWRDADLLADVALALTRSGYNPLNDLDDDRLATIEAALDLAGQEDSARRARLLAHLAMELSFGPDHERRNQVSDQALAIARRIDDPAALAEVLVLRSLCFSGVGFLSAQHVMDDVVAALEKQDLVVEQYYPELGHGQQELSIRHAPALQAADNHLKYRETVRAVAYDHGLIASFAPKPFADQAGNGCHIHFSLWSGGHNVFHNPAAEFGLSDTAQQFMAGVLSHLEALVAITAPSVNSYRRLAPGMWSSAYTAWGPDNREAALRVASPFWGKVRC